MLLKRTIPSILQGTEKSLSYAYEITNPNKSIYAYEFHAFKKNYTKYFARHRKKLIVCL